MNLRIHAVAFGAVLLGTAGLRIVRADYYARELKEIGRAAAGNRAREIETSWKALGYRALSGHGMDDELLAKIDWDSLDLNRTQKAKLKRCVLRVFRYLEKPSLEEYYRLRTEGFHFGFAPDARANWLLTESTNSPRTTDGGHPLYPREATALAWNKVHSQEGSIIVPRISAICLDSFALALSNTNSGKALLNGKVRKGFTVAVEGINPGFIYQQAASNPSQCILAQFSFFARALPSDGAGPVYISLRWIEHDQNWAIDRLITDKMLRFKTIF